MAFVVTISDEEREYARLNPGVTTAVGLQTGNTNWTGQIRDANAGSEQQATQDQK